MQRDTMHSSFDVMGLLTQHNTRWTLAKYEENQIVYSQGDPADSVFYIHTGKVKVTVISQLGKEAIVAIRDGLWQNTKKIKSSIHRVPQPIRFSTFTPAKSKLRSFPNSGRKPSSRSAMDSGKIRRKSNRLFTGCPSRFGFLHSHRQSQSYGHFPTREGSHRRDP